MLSVKWQHFCPRGDWLMQENQYYCVLCSMIHVTLMTWSNGSIFSVTGLLWGESTSHWWISSPKSQWYRTLVFSLICTSDAELWCFLWSAPQQTVEQTNEMLVIWDAIALIMTFLLCVLLKMEVTDSPKTIWHKDICNHHGIGQSVCISNVPRYWKISLLQLNILLSFWSFSNVARTSIVLRSQINLIMEVPPPLNILNMHLMYHLMSSSILAFLISFFTLKPSVVYVT